MFNSNGIDTCAILLIFALDTCALLRENEDLFNVGTVLFTSQDLSKRRWSRKNIELIQTRRYFQNILPTPSMNTLNEDYVDSLLNYFTDSFSTLKREVTDPGLTEVMERALADTIGGYLKVWVLPITKFTYYGGTISKDNAVKVFEFYDRLKRELNTDGSSWRTPSDIMLHSIAITVVPFSHAPQTRSMANPCKHLAYYEKTDTGLAIPMPYINWKESPHSIFLPVKNDSLIQLDSDTSSDAILKYYDIAQSCCHAENPDGCSEFDLRFQDWLSNNLVPHMYDDKLYIAFGGLLSLIDKNNEFIKRTSSICEYDYHNDKFTLNSVLTRLPPWMTSNKFLFLLFVLFVEIIWCVPAILYIICSRRQRKMKQRTKFFLDVFRRRYDDRCQTVGRTDNSRESNNYAHQKNPKQTPRSRHSHVIENGIKLYRRPRLMDQEVDTQCPSNTSKHSIGQVTSEFSNIINYDHDCQCESVTVVNEKKSKDLSHSSHVKQHLLSLSKKVKNTNQPESVINVQKLETTITKIIVDKSETDCKPCNKSSSSNKTIIRMGSEVKHKLQEISEKDNKNNICHCTRCFEEDNRVVKEHEIEKLKDSKTTKVKKNPGIVTHARNVTDTNRTKLPKLQTKTNVSKDKESKANLSKNIKLNKSKGLKFNAGEPLIEIRIDKPPAEITLDVFKTIHKSAKPSKIPRLTAATAVREEKNSKLSPGMKKVSTSTKTAQDNLKTVKKRSMDDIDIKTTSTRHNKMNVTL